MRKYSIWLTGVILLTIVAFLSVFQPITFSPRKDPTDASRYLRPANLSGKAGAFDPSNPNQAASFTLFGKTPVYAYTPQPDLSLGLDLRGGMRVVLEIASRGEFDYKLRTPLSIIEVSAKKAALTDAVNAALVGVDPKNIEVELSEEHATVTTNAQTEPEALTQLQKVTDAMTKVFGANSFDVPKTNTVFIQPDKQTQENVRNIMEKRINPQGTKEINAYAKGNNQVVIEIPGEKDPDHVRQLLGTTAEMNFMLLAPDINVGENPDGTQTISRG
ncbi:MAG TPA: hypothetical protein VGL77_17420, partial [Armatimonadota bacterium]